MSPRFTRAAGAAIIVAAGLVGIPACKKKSKSTEPDSPTTPAPGPRVPAPGPGPVPSVGPGDPSLPAPPRGPFFASAFEAQMRAAAKSDLTQIGLALHNYHDVNNGLPAGYADKSGKPGLSWRVAILPYIEQDALFKQFKLDEPWDSEHNKKLIGRMPKTFAPPRTDTNGYTFYRGFSGPNTWLPPQTGARPGQPLKGISLVSFTDGTSNTAVVAEAAEAVIWTKPDELEFGPNKLPQIGGVFGSGTHVLSAAGSVHFLRKGFDPAMLAKLIQTNDGQIVSWE